MIIVHESSEKQQAIYRMRAYKVQCDFCREACHKTSVDPGDAAELAREVGWSTKAGVLGDPLKWKCPKCQSAS